MALLEGCKHELEITVPLDEVDKETAQVVEKVRAKAKLPGFRPGKAPASLIRQRFEAEVRQEVLENLIPRVLNKQFETDGLNVVSQPAIKDLHFHSGEPLRFKAEFEVAPEIELKEYRGIAVTYSEPTVTDEDVEKRVEEIREQKAEYVNIDPRPAESGDYIAASLQSLDGLEGEPLKQDEVTLHLGAEDTVAAFTENLVGVSPGESREFDVAYPEDGPERLAGKTVRFKAEVKNIRRKELPELNDEFAKDIGDYNDLGELREAIRKSIFREREFNSQQTAKMAIVDKLVSENEFPVPEVFVDRQIESNVEAQLRQLAGQGMDVRKLNLDWEKLRTTHQERALHDVKASLILDKVASAEHIETTNDEVDREVHRIAKQERQPAAAIRIKLEKDGTLRRIASRIRTDKTLNLLFEQARKEAGE
ncbi:MAG: trigger factor [Bryobacteraceae bacterium]